MAKAHKKENTITYHFGKAILKEVAITNAVEVCPDGKDALLTFVTFSIKEYAENGLILLILNFKKVEMSDEMITENPMYIDFF